MQGRQNRAKGKLYRIHISRYFNKTNTRLFLAFMSDPGNSLYAQCTLTVDTGGLATWAHSYQFPSLFNVASTLFDSKAVTKVCGQQLACPSRLSW